MVKKIWWTFPALMPISLPALSVISCSLQTSETGTTEAGQFFFLDFKNILFIEASKTALSNADSVQSLKNNLLRFFPYDPKLKIGLKSLDVKIEGDFFVFDYEFEVPIGSIWDITVQNPSEFPPGRETLKGTIKAAGLKN